MFVALHKRLRNRDEGFTLIELMVVVLIIAILIAIAVPTFLGARKKAQDRAAQANIRNAFTAEKTFYTDTEAYSVDVATGGDLVSIEPSLTWAAGTGPPTVTTGNTVLVAGLGTVDANGDYPTIVVMAKHVLPREGSAPDA
ncbi:MAG: prepilin-type N-terminal cleavage/methylation domain-containing protein [Acidobacteria bacterium]|nr:prepilin-type N-terminal cleavage/methylation domain-containing protein [Acidobacteriota bacterium]